MAKMDWLKCARAILKYFRWFGVTSYSSRWHLKSFLAQPRLHISLPIIVQAVCSASICLYGIWLLVMAVILQAVNHSDMVIFLFFLLFQLGRIICTASQSICSRHLIDRVLYGFHKIETHFYIYLKYRVCYRKFRNAFIWRTLLLLFAFGQFVAITWALNTGRVKYPAVLITIRTMESFVLFTIVHALFFIAALEYHLNEFVLVVERDSINYRTPSDITLFCMPDRFKVEVHQILSEYKIIHFRLWELAEAINSYFGLYFVILFLHISGEFIFTSYWMMNCMRGMFRVAARPIILLCMQSNLIEKIFW